MGKSPPSDTNLEAGQLDPTSPSLEVGAYRIRPGDLVATRQNDRRLVIDRHRMVENRDHWTVEAVNCNGSVMWPAARGACCFRPTTWPATSSGLRRDQPRLLNANQGRTVDRSILYLDGPTGASGIYIPLSGGRESNDAYVVVQGEQTPADAMAEALSRTWMDRPRTAATLLPSTLNALSK